MSGPRETLPFQIQLHRELSDAVLDRLAELDRDLFSDQPFSREHIEGVLRGRHSLCVLFAERAGEVIGYKVGYEHVPGTFFSYLGGVRPAHRRLGVARALMSEQHRLALEWGYSIVRTHTHNEFRSMLILNIASGFDVVGVQQKLGTAILSIILEKRLGAAPT